MKRKIAWAEGYNARIAQALREAQAERRACEDPERRRQLARLVNLLEAERAYTRQSIKDRRKPSNRRLLTQAVDGLVRARRALLEAHGHRFAAEEWRHLRYSRSDLNALLGECDPRAVWE
jgi:hypothetical protein